MALSVIGTSFRRVPTSRLAQAVPTAEDATSRLVELRSRGLIQGGTAIRTCNRAEFIVEASQPVDALADHLLPGLTCDETLLRRGEKAAQHLLEVAVGLDSLAMGENQIIGQVSRAFRDADAFGLITPALARLQSRLLHKARDIRRRSGLDSMKISLPEWAARHVYKRATRVAVIGVGETGRVAAETLARARMRELFLVNRDVSKARRLANQLGAEAVCLRDFLDAPMQLDAMIIAVGGDQPLIDTHHVEASSCRCVIDLSVPHSVSAEAKAALGSGHIDIDSASRLSEVSTEDRDRALGLARDMVEVQAPGIHSSVVENDMSPRHLIDDHLRGAEEEYERAIGSTLRHLDPTDQERVRELLIKAAKRHAHMHLTDVRPARN